MSVDLTIFVSCRYVASEGQAAAGIVAVDEHRARAIHESGRELGVLGSAQEAAAAALERAIDVAEQFKPDSVAIRCDNELLVRQVTGAAEPGDAASRDRLGRVMVALLRLSGWHISVAEPSEARRSSELAQQAIEAGEVSVAVEDAEGGGAAGERVAVSPEWTAMLLAEPGPRCPSRMKPGRRYPFGPTTPSGCCIHAAEAALTDGPPRWLEAAQRRMTTLCPHCEAPIQLQRTDEP